MDHNESYNLRSRKRSTDTRNDIINEVKDDKPIKKIKDDGEFVLDKKDTLEIIPPLDRASIINKLKIKRLGGIRLTNKTKLCPIASETLAIKTTIIASSKPKRRDLMVMKARGSRTSTPKRVGQEGARNKSSNPAIPSNPKRAKA